MKTSNQKDLEKYWAEKAKKASKPKAMNLSTKKTKAAARKP
jgi:hypothetical protein